MRFHFVNQKKHYICKKKIMKAKDKFLKKVQIAQGITIDEIIRNYQIIEKQEDLIKATNIFLSNIKTLFEND